MAFPLVIPHSDGAGVVDEVGAGVPESRVGERVWLWNGQWKRAFGTAAEFVVVPSSQAVPLPARIGFEAGACLGIPAMTAVHAVILANASADTTLLVSGGAGAVSQYVIQFAKAKKAKVVATVSSPEKAEIAREAGADQTINYKKEDVGERVKEITGKRGVDAVIELDLTANGKLIPDVLGPKGTVVVYGTGPEAVLPAAFCLVNSIRLQFFLVYELQANERERAIADIDSALKSGVLLNRVAEPTFSVNETVAAHEAVERGTIGNVIVTF
jgi:NADPH2:quinone reductase